MRQSTLGEAVDEMEKDDVVREALGDHVFERLIEAQRMEWDDFRKHVSQWERNRYLEVCRGQPRDLKIAPGRRLLTRK